ncbi:MAG: Tol-Pal system beta propeller repeat protein TolB [Rhodospirillaceae bacterium]|nr:Tol-Pal system beta propeller repeat protein TolB [Rhodospirillaceae bacterium]
MTISYRNFLKLFMLVIVLGMSSPGSSMAELKIDITRGVVEPVPLAVTDFFGEGKGEQDFGEKIAGVIAADLERSGLFAPIDKKAFIQTGKSLNVLPRFGDWRLIKAQALVQGHVEMTVDGRLKVEFRLWDVYAEQQMVGLAYFSVPSNWRRVSHIIADAIYERITGERGYFDTRIVYIAETGPRTKRVKRLAIMDQDGENHRFLTDGTILVLTPRFSPTLQEITYLSYYNDIPRVYIFNIDSGRQERLGDFPNMTFAPRFSPDGKGVIMSMAKDGNSDIYKMDLATRKVVQLTTHSSIDTAPSYSPDGDEIVFESDRSGTQQLYTASANGGKAKRISFGPGRARYATPVWSPRGDWIAFTRIFGGNTAIGVMRTDGSGERILAQSTARGDWVEGPTWAPNGRVLMYFRQEKANKQGRGGRTRLFTIDITGHNEREVVSPVDASDPAWSPLNQ